MLIFPLFRFDFCEVSSFTLRNKAKMRFLIAAYTLCNNGGKDINKMRIKYRDLKIVRCLICNEAKILSQVNCTSCDKLGIAILYSRNAKPSKPLIPLRFGICFFQKGKFVTQYLNQEIFSATDGFKETAIVPIGIHRARDRT